MPFETKSTLRINKMKWILPLCFLYMCLLLVAGIVQIFWRGFDGMESGWVFSIGADVFCMAICLMLGYSCLRMRKDSSGYTRIFITLITLNAMALFLDECCWIIQGIPSLATWNLVINTLYYANGAVFIYFFWRYITFALNLEGKFMRAINDVMNVLLVPNILACFANLFYPLYFVVDAGGAYKRTEGTWIFSQTYLAIGLVAVILALVFSKAPPKTKLVTASFVAIPLINQVLTGYAFGISTQYSAMLVSIVLIYGVLFSDRAKALASTGRELALATRIQADMLPRIFPPFPWRDEFDIYATMDPAKEVGGDFYDFFLVDEDHLAIVMADVSGKGIPAALFMMVSKILIQNYTMAGKSPKDVLETVNEQICKNNREEMFVTVWLGILDIKTGKLTASNAGHEYPVIKRPDGDFEIFKDKHGFVVGGMSGVKYKEYELIMERGSKLFLYTDGVPEATNSENEMFGAERMTAALRGAENESPQVIIESVDKSISAFVGEAPQFDDVTMLCLEYSGGNEKSLAVPASIEKLGEVMDFVEEYLDGLNCSAKSKMQLMTSVEEIFVNVASYAYGADGGDAQIVAREKNGTVCIDIIDSGREYDPLQKPDPDITLSADERQIGGLGIYMTKKMVDEMKYERKNGKNILSLFKKI